MSVGGEHFILSHLSHLTLTWVAFLKGNPSQPHQHNGDLHARLWIIASYKFVLNKDQNKQAWIEKKLASFFVSEQPKTCCSSFEDKGKETKIKQQVRGYNPFQISQKMRLFLSFLLRWKKGWTRTHSFITLFFGNIILRQSNFEGAKNITDGFLEAKESRSQMIMFLLVTLKRGKNKIN